MAGERIGDCEVERLAGEYARYVDGFRIGGVLPPMMQLKLDHTRRVVDNARRISAGEGFDASAARACEIAALLHDTGRYEQFRKYGTFRDSDSTDHAVLSHRIVVDAGWLDASALSPAERGAVLDAVLFHNRRDLPDGLDALTDAAARTVRDADKLDIFRVLEEQVATTDWRHDCTAFWNLPTSVPPNPAVLDAIRAGRPVAYGDIRSLSDFVLIQVGWMISDLSYATSRRLCAERGHLAFRRDFLHRLVDSPAIDEICDLVPKS